MRRTPIIVVLGLFLLMTGCLGPHVNVYYNRQTDFTAFHTYEWLRPPRMAHPEMEQRVRAAVDEQLRAKGYQEVSDNADLGIVANGATHERQTLQTFYSGFPGGWRWWGWGGSGFSQTEVVTYPVGTLVIDIFNGHGKELVWRGTSRDTLSDLPWKNEQKVDQAVREMLRHFPPR